VDKRVADLVGRMNMEEKVNQLVLPFGAKFPADYQSFNTSGLGGTYPLAALPGQTWIETRNAWQRHAVENTRLGIPTSFIAETLHSGYAGGTNFPMPCLQGSTWNRPMVQEVAAVIGKEAAASGIDRGFSPVLHFCTVRPAGRAALPPCSPCEHMPGCMSVCCWSRTRGLADARRASASEYTGILERPLRLFAQTWPRCTRRDPMLISRMGEAAVTGLAGEGSAGAASTYLPEPDVHIATEAKHYA
jgi:beta-glucosidase-like glycosyl hydrolase